jgi:hypothetical protein
VKKLIGFIVIAAAVWFGYTHLDISEMLGGGGDGGGGGPVQHANLETTIDKTCHASSGRPTWCTITITNEASSNITFNWTGASDPGGAIFEPSSGSISIGDQSDEIKVTLAACPAMVLFQDKDHDIQTGTRVDLCDPNRIG